MNSLPTSFKYVVFEISKPIFEITHLTKSERTESREAMRVNGEQYEFIKIIDRRRKAGVLSKRATTTYTYMGRDFKNYGELALFITLG